MSAEFSVAECAKGGVCESGLSHPRRCIRCGRDLSLAMPYVPAPAAGLPVKEGDDRDA